MYMCCRRTSRLDGDVEGEVEMPAEKFIET